MARFLIINTGGTIGMRPGTNGLEPCAGEVENALTSNDQLSDWHEHELTWVHWNPLLDSSDLSPEHWFEIAQEIQRHSNIDGALVIHGTDTLAYTAAALSYLLSDLALPVVITGSMLPISASNTDAISNLQLSLTALLGSRNEVVVAVGDSLLPGTRTTKSTTQKHAAFTSPCWEPALWDASYPHQPCQFTKTWQPLDIAVVTLFPGLPVKYLTATLGSDPQAIIINSFGNGNAKSSNEFKQFLTQAMQKDIPVFVRSQCLEGDVNFHLYAAGSLFDKYGAISCGNMPFEALITKLLISQSRINPSCDMVNFFKQSISREWQV